MHCFMVLQQNKNNTYRKIFMIYHLIFETMVLSPFKCLLENIISILTQAPLI